MTDKVSSTDNRTTIEFTIQGRTATATVRQFPGGWHSVTHGNHTVSVAADGIIHLARHISPAQADDFVGTLLAAKLVAAKVAAAHGGAPVGPGLRNSAGLPIIDVETVPVFAPDSPQTALQPSPEVINRAKAIKALRAQGPSTK